MTVWVKLDDGFSRHPKILAIPDAALRLHLDAMCYTAHYLTDGVVPTEGLLVSSWRQPRALVEAGLWVPNGHGSYEVHDWLDYNPSGESVRKRRDRDRDRQARHRDTGRYPSRRDTDRD